MNIYVFTLGNLINLHMTDIATDKFLDIVEYEGITFVI